MASKKKSRQVAALEQLESRVMFSAVQPLAPDSAGGTGLVQQVAMLPTYEVYTPAGSLGPLATAGPQGYTPDQLRTAYGLTQVSFGAVAGDGSGQTIAIIDAYNDPTIQADLRAFDAAFGLPDTTLRVVSQNGSSNLPAVDPTGAGNLNWEGEEALDVEWAHAMAPGANIILVEAADSSPSNLFAAANWARSQADVSVVSMSFGGNETASQTQYDSIFTTPAGHNGVTFIASAGDSGAPAGYPAYSPNVVAVGGTSLALDSVGNYQSETAWNGTGGGISQVESQPSYQSGIVTQSSTFRTAPDIAFDAAPNTGVSIYDSYNNGTAKPWEIIGGTSLSAPAWAGIIAVADQGRVLAGEGTLDSRTGTLPLIYAAPAADFHDVTTGNNGFAAKAGYDLATGRGTPKANLLIPFFVSGTVTPPPPPTGPTIGSLTANALSVTAGQVLTLTANDVSDVGGTGITVTFYQEDNGVAGLQTDPATGDFAFTPVTDGSNAIQLDTTGALGTYTFYAQVTDASGSASSAGTNAPAITITIVAPSDAGPTIGSVLATPNPVVSGDVVTLSPVNMADPLNTIRRVYYYQETNGEAGLQTGPGGDFAFRPVSSSTGFAITLDTTGVTGAVTFYAQALDFAGNVSATGDAAASVDVTILSNLPPDSPTGLTATAVSSTEIDLAYSEADSGQTGFTIERSTSATFASFTRLFTINRADALTYIDTALTAGTKYYYRVQAFNPAGSSGFSNTANATTFTGSTTTVTASASSAVYGKAVTFTAHVTGPGGTPTGTVQFQIDGNNFGSPVTVSGGVATSDALSNLAAGSHVISAIYAGDGALSGSTGTASETIKKAPLTVTLHHVTKVYGEDNPVLDGTLSGLVDGDAITASYATAATALSDVGTYPITAAFTDPGNKLGNYAVTVHTSTLTITKATQTIAWVPPAAIFRGAALGAAELNATATGVAGGSATGELMYHPVAGTILTTGTHTLTVTAAATANYKAATMKVSLTVMKSPDLTVTVGNAGPAAAGGIINVPVTIQNIGMNTAEASAATPIVVDVRLSLDGTYDGADAAWMQIVITKPIAPGTVVHRTLTAAALPAGLAPGDYFVVAKVDATGVVAESVEGNNFGSSVDTLTVS